MPLKPDYISHKFRNWLTKDSGLAWEQSPKDWTSKMKEYFGKLGQEEGYRPIYTSETEKEYLVDIVWRCDKPGRYLGLAMESELSKDEKDILEDFEKLADIKARLKIGLFHLRSRTDELKIVEAMKSILNLQTLVLPNELYLVIFLKYDNDKREIIIDAYDLDLKGTSHQKILGESYPFARSS
jgi:hypothetical protein